MGRRRQRFAARASSDRKKTRTRNRDGSSWELAGVDRDRTDASRVWPVDVSGPWFHGGVPGLTLGDQILPPSMTGMRSLADVALERGMDPGLSIPEARRRVFVHRDPDQATLFAAMYPGAFGAVYQVEPAGPLEPDPDWKGDPGASAMTTYATIVRVVASEVTVGRG